MSRKALLQRFMDASMVLFYLQALRVIFSVLFGIIYDQVFEGPINAWLAGSNLLVVAVLSAPWVMRGSRSRVARWLPALAALARLFLSVDDAGVRFWAAILVLLFGGVAATEVLRRSRMSFLRAFLLALAADLVLRTAGHTYDVSLRPAWIPFQAAWLILILVGAWLTGERGYNENEGGMSWMEGLALGGLVFLETSLLALPHAIARWSSTAYVWHVPLTLASALLFLFERVRDATLRLFKKVMFRFAAAGSLAIALMLGYFQSGAGAAVAMVAAEIITLSLAVVVLTSPSSLHARTAGRSWALGMILLLVLNFLNAFAFTYPYTLPAMRGLGWVVVLMAALITGLVALLSTPAAVRLRPDPADLRVGYLFALIAIVGCALLAWPGAVKPFHSKDRLRLATYNIHYGYDDDWHWTLSDIAETIRAGQIDAIALQEVDTGRMTSYSADDALYLAQTLGMNVAYLPTVEHLTGIAILYRGGRIAAEAQLITSIQEQTGILHAPLELDSGQLGMFAIWMGLADEDTDRQIREALSFIGESSPAAFGGDFNAPPGSSVSRKVQAQGFKDPFTELGIDPPPNTSPAVDPSVRIDYVWLRGLEPVGAWVSDSLASDHRMVVVEIAHP
jgi:endonuclease/exonuclease/phosphatase family metal-dependent hydrolase